MGDDLKNPPNEVLCDAENVEETERINLACQFLLQCTPATLVENLLVKDCGVSRAQARDDVLTAVSQIEANTRPRSIALRVAQCERLTQICSQTGKSNAAVQAMRLTLTLEGRVGRTSTPSPGSDLDDLDVVDVGEVDDDTARALRTVRDLYVSES